MLYRLYSLNGKERKQETPITASQTCEPSPAEFKFLQHTDIHINPYGIHVAFSSHSMTTVHRRDPSHDAESCLWLQIHGTHKTSLTFCVHLFLYTVKNKLPQTDVIPSRYDLPLQWAVSATRSLRNQKLDGSHLRMNHLNESCFVYQIVVTVKVWMKRMICSGIRHYSWNTREI